jgi:hypothetical protein
MDRMDEEIENLKTIIKGYKDEQGSLVYEQIII